MRVTREARHPSLRILWVVSKLSFGGGVGRVLAGALPALAARGHAVHVAGPAPEGEPAPLPGVALHPWPVRRIKLANLGRLIDLQRGLRADVIHFHSALPHGELIAPLRALRSRLGAPVLLVTPHTATRIHYPKLRARFGLRAADAVVTPSAWSAEAARRARVDPGRVRVVHAGIDLPEATPLAEREPVVLSMGRLVQSKGVDVLVEAFARAAAARAGWRLEVAGAGREASALREKAARSPCAERISFLGQVAGEAKRAALSRASIGVVPSRSESFGGTLLEFAAQGLACVATAVGGMAELVGGGRAVRCIPPGDVGALADALAELMDDGEARRRRGEAARALASGFSWEETAARYEEVYREFRGRSRSRGSSRR
jgi:glycosyltransferase involved in cell wall biosynthesis